MRVVVYNLKAFRFGRAPIAQVLRELTPDVALLQESGPRRELRRLADDLGMRVAADPWAFPLRRIKNAVMTAPAWEIVEERLHRFPGTERLHPRGALVARAQGPSGSMRLISAHLGLVPAERAGHSRLLADLAARGDGPTLLGADLNETPDRSAGEQLARSLRDAWGDREGGATFPADGPSARIDVLFVSTDVRVDAIRVASEAGAASDHLPLVAEVGSG